MKENPFLADTSRLVYLVQYAERIRTQDPGLDVLIKEHSGNWFDIATRSEPKSHAELMVDATRFDDDQLMDVVQRMPDAPSGMSAAALSLAVRRLADVGFVASDDDLAAIAKAVMVYDPFRRPRHAASLAEPMIGFCLGVKSHNRIFEAVLGAFIKAVKGLPMHERGDIVLSVTKVCQYRLKGLTKKFPTVYRDAGADNDLLMFMMDAHRRMLGSRKANPIDERAVQITEAAMVQEALFLFAKDQARFIEIVNTLPEPKSRYLVERLLYDGAGRPLRILKDHYRDINNDEVRDIVLGALCLQGDHQHWSVHFAAIKDREKRRETLQKAVNLALSEDELKLLFGIACHLDALDGGHYLKAAFLHACDTVIQCESEADECWIEEDQLN